MEVTQELLSAAPPRGVGEVTDGIAPILLPPGGKLRVVGRPRRQLIEHLRTQLGNDDAGSNASSSADVVIASYRARHQAVNDSAPGTRLLIDTGRRLPSMAHQDDMIIELRGTRMIEAKSGASALAQPTRAVPRRWRSPRSFQPVKRAFRQWLHRTRHTRWALLRISGGSAARVPEPLGDVLRSAGLDVDEYQISLHDRRRHRTQKVLIRLTSPNEGADFFVKLVRDPTDSHRIVNEAKVVQQVAKVPIARDGVPPVLATGHLSGRSFLVQPLIEGEPLINLLNRTDRSAENALRQVLDWTIALGNGTCHSPRHEEFAALREIVDRFLAAAQDPQVVNQLQSDIATVAEPDSAAPLVFMHGDLGTWNVVVEPDGRIKVLDWEAGEPHGLPLWDIFYLLRNAAVSPGDATPGAAVRHELFENPRWNGLLRRTVLASIQGTGTSPEVVPALFRLCWVHRAVKEAKRLGDLNTNRGYAQLAGYMAAISDQRLRTFLLGNGNDA